MHLLKWKYWGITATLSWRKNLEKQSCTDLNLKMASTNAALMKTGAFIKPNEITV